MDKQFKRFIKSGKPKAGAIINAFLSSLNDFWHSGVHVRYKSFVLLQGSLIRKKIYFDFVYPEVCKRSHPLNLVQ